MGDEPRPSPYQLRTLSVPSPMFARFAGFAMFAGVCFSIFLVGEIFFPSWEGVIVSLGCGEENLRGIRGQRPHGRRAPSPCRVGAGALEETASSHTTSCSTIILQSPSTPQLA